MAQSIDTTTLLAKRGKLLACFAITGSFLLGILVGQSGWTEPRLKAEGATPQPAIPFTPQMRIGGNLYLQTSAEYQAACLQVYRSAGDRLHQLVKASEITGQLPAVIMDLDETVLDNSSFQTYLYQSGQDFTDALWGNYEQNFSKDITLIPGTKQFIHEATSYGVSVLFLSNRLEANQPSTIAALERLGVAGVNVTERLFLKKDSSDKTSRRDRIAAKYNVLLIIGDNLRDFSEVFVNPKLPDNPTAPDVLAAIAKRKGEVERSAVHWGKNWFILPNPVYGEWDRLIKVDPISIMHPTSIPVPPHQ